MAQLVEHFIRNERVRGSSPRVGSYGKNIIMMFLFFCIKSGLLTYGIKKEDKVLFKERKTGLKPATPSLEG